ncbi:chitin deacetylase 8-like [Oppia nitens]|uniref:chitin deacetylase 8-like n=1 Tax=Oppia nitens TaxID=1686743 RepID=UPI0023DA233F|nr:chitin deacetylase 8-like [Oppia nitens]
MKLILFLFTLICIAYIVNGQDDNVQCTVDNCKAPHCSCFSSSAPYGHKTDDIPQFIIMSFDEAVREESADIYDRILNYTNPNGCPIEATFFVSHVDTNYKRVHELYRRGHEISTHSITKTVLGGQEHWKNLDVDGWRAEFGGMKKILSKYADIPISAIVGARAPELQTAGNVTFTALKQEGFLYDSSQPSRAYSAHPLFPYTLDFGFQADCQIQPCLKPDQIYPGFWSAPMNDWVTKLPIGDNKTIDVPCAEVGSCILYDENGTYIQNPTPEEFLAVFEDNFNRFYTTNRAPFPLFLRDAWLTYDEKRIDALIEFIDRVTKNKNVYFVSISEVIDWMGRGANNTLLKNFKQTKCEKNPPKDKCGVTSTVGKGNCEYKHIKELKGIDKLVVICNDVECPLNYPWIESKRNETFDEDFGDEYID